MMQARRRNRKETKNCCSAANERTQPVRGEVLYRLSIRGDMWYYLQNYVSWIMMWCKDIFFPGSHLLEKNSIQRYFSPGQDHPPICWSGPGDCAALWVRCRPPDGREWLCWGRGWWCNFKCQSLQWWGFRRWKTTNYCKPHRGKTLLRASAFFAGFLSEGMSDDWSK